MDFTIAVDLTHPPHLAQDALLDPAFIARTATLPKISGGEVLELTRAADSARLRVRYRFTAPLSGAVTRVVDPNKLTWVDDATFDLGALRSEHVMLPDNYADRLQSRYVSELTARGDGATWIITGALTVHFPLVGGRVAGVIVDGLREHAVAQGALLDEWLASRA